MKKISVIVGGLSGERDVSLISAQGVIKSLKEEGFEVYPVELTRDIGIFIQQLQDIQPDVVFLGAIHGRWAEDGCLQGLLELLGYPYTNSGVQASALAMDKPVAKRLFIEAGLKTPESFIADYDRVKQGNLMPFPYVIKPLKEGSSLGVAIINSADQLEKIEHIWSFGDEVLIERYIPGREIQVAVLGDRAWGAIELRPKNDFYDYESKYVEGKTEHLMPAPLLCDIYDQALSIAKKAHDALGCEGVTRVDLRYDDTTSEKGTFYVLEVNTQPGFTPLSLVPEIVSYYGMTYGKLLTWMIEHPHIPDLMKQNEIFKSPISLILNNNINLN